ncbi:CocE/NonD family hydrolase [Virgibacillus pantothenticus]|uniref:CocE/NonD family hydrolase n=1 Tax=Virgibacillus pantothenticus TaxID=1473 RepID=UPI001C21648F|nr:CocE/NonD family hydrolase [Virgibacillus pantothenticus]MBU8568819.1 CocE/NonD family hydrolase [Virgibacillus pantothenticus]MBU8602833.1 CocE/NonD family hydrolase [Virgibacillus pantothenticus]MBU8636950.1 CocE/NonD family hydrolase [Virgibacillus pantothenticus]MBU8644705.1 CocE/NonD family hydrolase [Virgibacillus pantothenticus]MBU8648808.1 CocE/NonD family hydrolase [Virgibacillus pantothenticus]
MERYLLYRSGIHDATIEFEADKILYRERDIIENKWLDTRQFPKEKATEWEEYYHINPLSIWRNFSEYKDIFRRDSDRVTTSWGDIYSKENEHSQLWVQREKKFPLDVVVKGGEPVAFISVSREECNVFVKAGYENHTPVEYWKNDLISEAKYGVELHGTFMVPMRDNVRLATDVWIPKGASKPRPVIFVRTPYGKNSYKNVYVQFIQRGYGVVIQDTRGREESEGKWIPMAYEMEDGDDSLNWIASQPWCDGNIGMIGASYGGFVQWAAAASGNPHLKALVSIVTAGSPFIDVPRKGGAFVSGMLAWAFAMVEKQMKPENMLRDDWDEVLKIRPLRDIPKQALGRDVHFWNEWLSHPVYDNFWDKGNWHQYKERIQVPAMIISGWYDDNGMGTTEALDVVSDYDNKDKKVLLGPWMHNANTLRDIQGVALGNNALRYDLDVYHQLWFDNKLKGIDNGIDTSPSVEYYVTGENEWRKCEQWPPEQVKWSNFYLNRDGNTHASAHNGNLILDPSTKITYEQYLYDPNNPAPHLIDLSENEIGVPGNYRWVEERDDVLIYETPFLETSLTIAGDMYAEFYASSSAKDTDWIVRLTDVDENGNSIKLVDGVMCARFRNGFNNEALLKPWGIYKFTIQTSKIAHTFKVGHRIRLTITSSAENFIFPNANTGNDPADDVEVVQATQRIYHGGEYVSYVRLPVIE